MTTQEREALFNGRFKRPAVGRLKAFGMLIAIPVIMPVTVVLVTIFIIKVLFEIILWNDKESSND